MNLKNLLSRFRGQWIGPSASPIGPPDPVLEGLPDFVEPLLGWRAWKIRVPQNAPDSCPSFSSIILDTPWTPRRKVSAEHSFDLGANCHGLVQAKCSCGVYAYSRPAEAFDYLTRVRDRLACLTVEVGLGSVSLWGRVVQCERGYKAQYAYPRHIYLPATFARYLPVVSSSFGVPVGIYASTCEDEITLAVSSGHGCKERWNLRLKYSGSLNPPNLPTTVGFYDLDPFEAGQSQVPSDGTSFWPPDSDVPGPPADPPWS